MNQWLRFVQILISPDLVRLLYMCHTHIQRIYQMAQARRFWSPQEDQALTRIVHSMPAINWTLAALQLFNISPHFARNSKQCRERWLHKLSIEEHPGEWTVAQEDSMVGLFVAHHWEKNKWKIISEGLTDGAARHPTEVKNRFYSMVRRGLRRINNFIGKEFQPQQIRILKPKTISSLLDKTDAQECSHLVRTIYSMASTTQPAPQDPSDLRDILHRVLGEARNNEQKKEQAIQEKNESRRKSSMSTSENDFSVSEELKRSQTMSTWTEVKQEEVVKWEEANIYESDIGRFLDMGMGVTPVLEFEDFEFQY